MIKYICESMIGDSYASNVPYAIWGLGFNGTQSSPTDIGAGYIYFNGELYFCGGLSPIVTGDLFTITVTNDPTADPLTFTDLVARNVHNVRRIVVTDTAAAPIFPQFTLSSVVYLQSLPWTNATLTNSWANSNTLKYRKEKDRISITGTVTNATSANAALSIMTLPAGFRPAADTYKPVHITNAGTIYNRFVEISASTGTVTLEDTTGFSNVTTTVTFNVTDFVVS